MKMKKSKKIFLLIGAGFSKPLGMPLTKDMEEVIKILLSGKKIDKCVYEIAEYLGLKEDNTFRNDIRRLLIFSKYDDEDYKSVEKRFKEERERYLKKISEYLGKDYERVMAQVVDDFSHDYDYIAFKSVYKSFYKRLNYNFELYDFLTLLTFLYSNGITVYTSEIYKNPFQTKEIYDERPYRILKALFFFRLFFLKIFKHLVRYQLKHNKQYFKIYLNFFETLLKEFRKRGWKLIIGTFNWDLIVNFLVFKANANLNKIAKRTIFLTSYGIPLYMPYELEHKEPVQLGTETLEKYHKKYCKNPKDLYLTQVLFPHGTYNLRYCSNCRNLVFPIPYDISETNFGTLLSHTFSLVDPLPSERDLEILKKRISLKKDLVPSDYVKCPYCGTYTNFRDTFMLEQSKIKTNRPSYAEILLHKFFYEFLDADVNIVIGYSFPPDDMLNNYYLKSILLNKHYDKSKRVLLYFSHGNKKGFLSYKDEGFKKFMEKNKQINDLFKLLYNEKNIYLNLEGFGEFLKRRNNGSDIAEILSVCEKAV